jgi:hypothetical protein
VPQGHSHLSCLKEAVSPGKETNVCGFYPLAKMPIASDRAVNRQLPRRNVLCGSAVVGAL